MEIDLYRAISNSHMANALFAHVPGLNLVSQGDFTDETWEQSFWANTYPASVAYWKLKVDRDLSVHGSIHTYAEVLDQLRAQVKGAQALCAKAEAASQRSSSSAISCPASSATTASASRGRACGARRSTATPPTMAAAAPATAAVCRPRSTAGTAAPTR